MHKIFHILRRESPETESYWEDFPYDTSEEAATVATALAEMNRNRQGGNKSFRLIAWDHSCLQKKCGACAMVIDGIPRLACKTRLIECGDTIRLEPLKKFPVVEDLLVDRSLMMENLKDLSVWFEDQAGPAGMGGEEMAYEASRCLQCGLCLEVCPNFYGGGSFAGMAGMAPLARLLARLPKNQRKKLAGDYKKGVYEGCGKSLACRDICPAGIDLERLLVRSNAAAIWKRWNVVNKRWDVVN